MPYARYIAAALALAPVWIRADTSSPAAAIRAEAIHNHIEYLASDALAGRGSGTKGNEEAARYIASAFRGAGLKPLGTARQTVADAKADGSGYFQPFTFTAGLSQGKDNRLEVTINKKKIKYRAGGEFEPSLAAARGTVSGEIVFVGYGTQNKDSNRDDYAGVDVRGKIALALADQPAGGTPAAQAQFPDNSLKPAIARDKGASALILVQPKDGVWPRLTPSNNTNAGIPIILLKRKTAAEWLASIGKKLEDLEQSLLRAPQPFVTGIQVTLSTDVRKVTKTTANICGLLEGSDSALKKETVVIGAHMDHLGMGGPGSLADDHSPAIHHGADDNASGTAGVLALADYFSSQASRPKRSLLFICFSGEELGLLGSMHYAGHPLLPEANTVAMLNMDMIGRLQNDRLIVVGSGTSPAWNSLLDEVNSSANFTLSRSESGFGASDQQSFYAHKIPVLFFFTGLHSDYHRPTDTADKINAEGEARVVNFVARCAAHIADAGERPAYQEIKAADSAPARFRVSLGSIPDYAAEVEGVMLSGVRPGSPADKAGLKQGDIIVKFGERSIRNVQEYAAALSERKPGDVVRIVVKRGGQTVTVAATLAESRR